MRNFTMSSRWASLVLTAAIAGCSGGGSGEKERVLDTADESVQRDFHNFYFFDGYGPTLDFVIFPDQSAAVRLRVDNFDPYAVTASVNLFESGAEIDKWINNQYSDALEPDAPSPIAEYDISASVTIVSVAFLRTEDDPTREDESAFDVYDIQYTIADVGESSVYTLTGYAGATEVYVASGAPAPNYQGPTPTLCGDIWYDLTVSGLLDDDTIEVRWNPGWSGPYTGDSRFGNVSFTGIHHEFCGRPDEFPPQEFTLLDTTGYECERDGGEAGNFTITVECTPIAGRK